MKSATPSTTKAVRRPRCKHCRKQFRTTSAVKVYCTRECKQLAASAAKRTRYIDKARDSAFFQTLAFEAQRAGTLEIFTGLDVESLAELYRLYAFKLRANRFGEAKDYELSHISPSQGHDIVGLYHPSNLVVAPRAMNRAHGNQHYGHGLSIARNKLQPRHTVERGDAQKIVVQRLIKFIGPDIVAQASKLAGMQPSKRVTVLSWLRAHLDPRNDQHRDWLDNLDTMTTKALTALRASIEGKEAGSFTFTTRAYTQFEVMYQELERHAQHRPELHQVLKVIRVAVGHFFSDWSADIVCYRSVSELASWVPAGFMAPTELQALFDALHGKDVDAIRPVLGAFAERHSGVIERTARVVAAVQRPISFLTAAREFAAELDAVQVQDIPTVLMPGHTLEYVHEPLPW